MVQGKGRDGGSGFFENLEVDNPTAWHSDTMHKGARECKREKGHACFHACAYLVCSPGPALLSALEGGATKKALGGGVVDCLGHFGMLVVIPCVWSTKINP